jgi:hypothetical protein
MAGGRSEGLHNVQQFHAMHFTGFQTCIMEQNGKAGCGDL